MKILVAFHSRGGVTKRVAEEIKRTLEEDRHHVDIEEIKPIKDRSFLSWYFLRIIQSDVEIQEPKIKDVSKYNVVVLGSPNWTRVSLPMRRYIRERKEVIKTGKKDRFRLK